MAYNKIFRGKKVLITGNTGFKGSWLSTWLMGLLLIVLIGCSEEDVPIEPEVITPEIVEGQYIEWNLSPKGAPVRLCVGIDSLAKDEHYAWYKVVDGKETELGKVVNNYYDTPAFSEKGIVNLLCKVSYTDADTLVLKEYPFHVAFTGLPAFYVATETKQEISREEKVPGTLLLVGGGRFNDVENVTLQINGRGNSSWNLSTKRSYNLKLDEKEEICGMPKSKKWALIDNHHDRSLLRNRYVSYINHNVFTKLGWNASYVSCDFVLNGVYKGNYIVAERNKIEKNRLNFKDISEVSDFTEGGFLCEVDERFDEERHFRTTHGKNAYNGNEGIAICLKEPDEVSDEVFDYVRLTVQNAEDVLFSDNFRDTEKGYAHYFEVDALVDWYLIHEFVCMYDASSFYTSAFFYYNPDDKKIHMGPCWDYDTAMRRVVPRIELREINSWYKRLFEDNHFYELVKARWNEKKTELKESIRVLDQFADEIRVSAEYNFMRWEILGTPYEGLDSWVDLKTYQDQVDFLKDWLTGRYALLDSVYGD